MRALKRTLLAIGCAVAAYLVIGAVAHFLVFPLADPDPATFPRAGDRLVSRWEGLHQEILKVEGPLAYTRLVIEPGAQGPPIHLHREFAESFRVAEGVLRVWVDGETVDLGPGESITIPPGARHKPFNPGRTRVVVEGGETPTFPISFAGCLVQLYGWMDESPENMRGARPLFQMTLFQSACDTHLLPAAVEPVAEALLAPTARLLGLRSHYPRFALHAADPSAG